MKVKLATHLQMIDILKDERILTAREFLVFVQIEAELLARVALKPDVEGRQRVDLDKNSVRIVVKNNPWNPNPILVLLVHRV